MNTVKDLVVGSELPGGGRVYHISELTSGYRHLTVERADKSSYTTYLHQDTPLSEARGGGSYKSTS